MPSLEPKQWFCPALSHLRIELIPQKRFIFTAELCQSLKSLELHADDLSSFTACSYIICSEPVEIISSVVNDWVNKNCHPSQLVISHGTLTDELYCLPISSLIWLLCRDIHPPPEARGQLRVCVDGSLSIFPSYPYFEVLVENSQFRVPVTNCSGITSSPLLHTRSQTQCVCVTARATDSQPIPMETLFSDIGPSLTHLMFGSSFSSTQISLDEIAYNCPGSQGVCPCTG